MTAEPPPTIESPEAAPPGTTVESKSGSNVRVEPGSVPLAEMWARVMSAVEQIPSIAVATEPMRPLDQSGSTIRLGAPARSVKMFTEFQREKLESEIERVFGERMRVVVVEDKAPPAERWRVERSDAVAAVEREVDSAARSEAMKHPVVKKATELFDAKLIRVDPAE